jgi:hypothetical protein
MSNNLPTTYSNGSAWDDGEDRGSHPIKGPIVKCTDGFWSARDGSKLPGQLLACGTATILQCWKDGMPIDTVSEYPLPNVDSLNEKIPEETWEKDKFTGVKVAPWRKCWLAYLLDPVTMARYTFINSTAGARQAVDNLRDAVKLMRGIRGDSATPLVELASAPMKTKYGTKNRPEFRIVRWVVLGGDGNGSGVKQIAGPQLQEVKPPSICETLNDDLPSFVK